MRRTTKQKESNMSDEIKETEEKQECKCFCRSEGFRKFLVVALGSFVGVYCALSLFAATHRPPVRPPHFHGKPCHCRMVQPDFVRIERFEKGDFQKQPPKFERKAPFEAQRKVADD